LLGLALALPATDAREHQQRVAAIGQALWALNADEELSDAPRLDLCWAPGLTWSLRPSAAPTARSLKPSRYARRARIWTSVTPIVLDRFPKGDRTRREEELTAIIARSCEYVGLDRPSKIVVAKHPAPSGAVSAYPSGNGPEWTGWTLPESLRGRLLTHATIEFSEPVSGPVVIGAGRFVGLGLCLPVDERGQR
jgi:CRISPR-associated protein Csb2